MSRVLLSIILVCLTHFMYAQSDIKFGEISIEELKKEKSQIEANASAEVLGEFGSLIITENAGGTRYYIFEYHKRIKIYDSEGYENADVTIPFFHPLNGSEEKMLSLKAYTYNLKNGKVEKIKLTNKEIITEQVSKNWKAKKISFPQVKEGSVIEYKYKISSYYILDVPDWVFQKDIPVVWSQYDFSIPKWFRHKIVSQGSINYTINTQKEVRDTNSKWNLQKSVWAVSNIVPLKDEKYVSSKSNYVMKLNFHMNARVRQSRKIVGQNYPEFNTSLMESTMFVKLLLNNKFLPDNVIPQSKASSDQEKALALYNYVQKQMTWDDYSGFLPGDVKKAWKEKRDP
ncbi:MAG: DUF3857 domain-containing protein [Bacteroidota bacterium]